MSRETIVRSGTFDLVRQRSAGSDARRVLVKIPTDDSAPESFARQLENELELTATLDPASVLRGVRVEHDGLRPCLILEDANVRPLATAFPGGMDLRRFFPVAISACRALERLHESSVIHKNLSPQTILVEEDTGRAVLSDLRFGARVPREQEFVSVTEPSEQVLPYISPEQTGRMGRLIDPRSDLYSFGISLYWMLTGQLPFAATDALAWVHCHLARQPASPSSVRREIPETLSQIVLKLLRKNPEERYQSAKALRCDLEEAVARWTKSGAIEPFTLGATDLPKRFRVPQTLIGREVELGILSTAIRESAASRRKKLILVTGPAGMGKSSLVRQVQRTVLEDRGFFLAGKFDELRRNVPHAAIGDALGSWVDWLLGEDEQTIERFRRELRTALGLSGRLATEIAPPLVRVLGELPPAPPLPAHAEQGRLRAVLHRLCQVIATDHPLVLFLDDLQWADSASFGFLEHLIGEPERLPFVLIGAYRADELAPSHPLQEWRSRLGALGVDMTEIALGPLGEPNVSTMLRAITFRTDPEVQDLARLTIRKTGGNPFFVIQFLAAQNREGLLAFDTAARRWAWDLAKIAARPISDNVVDLFVDNIAKLPPATLAALQTFAAIGGAIAEEVLATALAVDSTELQLVLAPAIAEGFIGRSAEGYVFLHDRIHQAAYQTIGVDAREALHLGIGRRLADRYAVDASLARLFEIVGQVNRAIVRVTDEGERKRFAELNVEAANRAKSSASYTVSVSCLDAAIAWTGSSGTPAALSLRRDALLLRSECQYLLGDHEGALTSLSGQIDDATDARHRSAVYRLRMIIHTNMGDFGLAVDDAIRCLELLGLGLTAHPSEDEVIDDYRRVRSLVGQRRIQELVELPEMRDPARCAAIDVMADLIAPAYLTDERLLDLVACRMTLLSLEHGNARGSALGYTCFGMILGPRFGEYEDGREFGQLGLAIVDRMGAIEHRTKVLNYYGNYVDYWTMPLRRGRDFSKEGLDVALAADDVTYACYHHFQLVAFRLVSGDPLDQVQEECLERMAFVSKANFHYIGYSLAAFLRFIASMRGQTRTLGELGDETLDQARFERLLEGAWQGATRAFYQIVKLEAQCLARDFTGAVATATACEPEVWPSRPHVLYPEFVFFHAFALEQVLREGVSEPGPLREKVDRYLAKLAEWSALCPQNFRAKHALLLAEVSRTKGGGIEVLRSYEDAIRAARESSFRHYEALADEQAASFASELGLTEVARNFAAEAIRAYGEWGADGKVAALRSSGAVIPTARRPREEQALDATTLDLLALLKASQALSEELELTPLLHRLLHAMVESSGATRGVLVELRNSQLSVRAEATTVAGAIQVTVPPLPRNVSGTELSLSLVNRAWRTGEIVLLDENTAARFWSDAYLRRELAKSILCVPIRRTGRSIGILYLENTLAPDVFTSDRITALEILLAQAAISLDNARLYSDLRASEAKFKRLYDSNIVGVVFADMFGTIEDANDQYLNIIGYSREDIARGVVRWDAITPPEWLAFDELAVAKLRETGVCAPYEKEYVRKDGRRVAILIVAARLEAGSHSLVAFVLDVTDRKRDERTLAFLAEASRVLASSLGYDSTIDHIAKLTVPRFASWCLMVLTRPDGGERLLCSVADAAKVEVGRAVEQGAFDAEAPEGLPRVLRTGEALFIERVGDADLRPGPGEWSVFGAQEGPLLEAVRQLGLESFIAVPFVIRDRRIGAMLLASAEPNRRYTRRDLVEVEALAQRCSVAIENAELYEDALRSIQLREDFLSITSHELRTPLTPLRMQIEFAIRVLGAAAQEPGPSRDALRMLRRTDRQITRLVRLVDDLLDVSQITAGKFQLNPERVDLAALVGEVVKRVKFEAVRARCEIRLALDNNVVGAWDRGRIEQVLLNLLSNAMKFGAGRPIELIVTATDQDAVLSVRDHGEGIAPADQGRIFERFERAAPVKHFGGLGLGLYVVREIVRAHGGTIAVTSALGEGSCFTVHLPRRTGAEVGSGGART